MASSGASMPSTRPDLDYLCDRLKELPPSYPRDIAEEVIKYARWCEAVIKAGIEQLGIDTFKRAGFFRETKP